VKIQSRSRALLWSVPAVFYLLFCYWYTDFGGPLSPREIAAFTEQMRANGAGPAQIANLQQFMESDTGRQFVMVNNIDMAENPPTVAGAEPGETAGQLMNRYMEHMYPELFKRACHPVFAGVAVFNAMDVVGIEGAERWDTAALMRYRSRRDLLEIALNPIFGGKHDFKTAALDKTIAYPVETQVYLSDPRFLLALILLAVLGLLDLLIYRRRV